MKSIDEYTQQNGHQGVLEVLNKGELENAGLIVSGLNLIVRLMDVSGALDVLQKGDTVDVVLKAMLSYQDVLDVQFAGKAILDRIATEGDVNRYLEHLDRSISGGTSALAAS